MREFYGRLPLYHVDLYRLDNIDQLFERGINMLKNAKDVVLVGTRDLDDGERAKVLGLNAARIFKFEIPARYRKFSDSAAIRPVS